MQMFDRKDITELTREQIAPLESLMAPEWSDTWRELATSHYITLISAPGAGAVAVESLAQLAVALTMGLAQDLGGTQPYIPVGADVMSSTRTRRVIELLQSGMHYKEVADSGPWHAELTRYGVDVAEYTIDCEPGIARPAKYW